MKIDLLGVKIDNLTKTEVINKIKTLLKENRAIFIVTPYSEMIVAAQKNPGFREILNSADISLPDGVGILWAAKYLELRNKNHKSTPSNFFKALWQLITSLLTIIVNPKYTRQPIPEKISGSDFIWDLAGLAQKYNYSIFLLGGFEDTPEIAAGKLCEKFPGLKIAGTLAPFPDFFLPLEGGGKGGGEIINKINSSGADFLFVAFGPCVQEKWIYENLPKSRLKLAIGLGGTFDYLAKKRPYRPKKWAIRGLEWAWRLLTQPWRIWRIFKGVLGLIFYTFNARLRR